MSETRTTSNLTLPINFLVNTGIEIKPVPTLTILYHPIPERIGEYASLPQIKQGRPISFSRNMLDFSPYSGVPGHALNDPYLSRQPLIIEPTRSGYVLKIAAGGNSVRMAQGEILTGDLCFDKNALERGIYLVIAERILLLLHLREASANRNGFDEFGLIGRCDALRVVRQSIEQCAQIDTDVLVLGESGTGKELVAEAIHRHSARSENGLVSVNMSAIPISLAAAELFGSVKGAYTGADSNKPGYIRLADSGTLFLDEIGDTPGELQPQLLRVLESREVQPVGGTPCKVNVRFISASDADLDSSGFRTALRHRLGSYEIHLPPLRERQGDVASLILHFLNEEYEKLGLPNRLSDDSKNPETAHRWLKIFEQLCCHSWPGNVRELRNIICQLVIHNQAAGAVLMPVHIHQLLKNSNKTIETKIAEPLRRYTDVTADELHQAMQKAKWEIMAAAKILGVSRQSIYKLIESDSELRMVGAIPRDELLAAYEKCEGDFLVMRDYLKASLPALRRRLREFQ